MRLGVGRALLDDAPREDDGLVEAAVLQHQKMRSRQQLEIAGILLEHVADEPGGTGTSRWRSACRPAR